MATLDEWVSAQSLGTQATMQATKSLMNYFHTHSDAKIIYCAIQIQLHTHSDVSYLSKFKVRSRVGIHFFLSDKFNPMSKTKHNGAILVVAAILKIRWLPQQRHNWEAYSSTPKKDSYSEPHWKKCDTHNGQHPYKRITPQPQASSMKPSNNAYPKPYTCVFIGLEIDANKNTS